jgi:YVTN family beta-propeller protein
MVYTTGRTLDTGHKIMRTVRIFWDIVLMVCILSSPFGCSRELSEAFKDCWDGPLPTEASRLPNGRVVLPAGKQISVKGFPQNLALSPDGRTLVVTLNGLGKAINQSLLTMNTYSGSMHYMFIPTLFQGIAMSPDGSRVYASGGGDNVIYVLSVGSEKSTFLKSIPVDGYPVGLTVSPTGEVLAACSLDNTLKVVDPSTMAVTITVPVGSYPWAVAVDKEGDHIYVTNREDGTISSISANGDPVKTIGLREKDHPAALAISPDRSRIYVANANTDTLGIISGESELIQAFYSMGPFPVSNPGSIPSAMVLSPDGRRLYVALSGENAVSVYSVPDMVFCKGRP